MCGGGIVPNVPATIRDSSDPTHSLVRLTSHNLETREPHPKNTSPACSQPPVTTAAEVGRAVLALYSYGGTWRARVLILCSLFLSIKTFEGGGAFVQATWLSSAVISRECANSSSHPADTEGKPSGLEGGWGGAQCSQQSPRHSRHHRQRPPPSLLCPQRLSEGWKRGFGDPWLSVWGLVWKAVCNMHWDLYPPILKTNYILLCYSYLTINVKGTSKFSPITYSKCLSS